ncbi:MAG: YhbY family RNA-binding protein [Clostridiales bacterium]|nr:YhbY family RNA-binding protein [Clostridiales bacterium]
MELNGKQRAYLRSLANTLETTLYVGKEGITAHTQKEAYDLLQARELVKCAVQQNAPLSAREASEQLCGLTGASPVQVIGRRFTIYRKNDKEPRIQLP